LESAKKTFDEKEEELRQQIRELQQKYEEQHQKDQIQIKQLKKSLKRGFILLNSLSLSLVQRKVKRTKLRHLFDNDNNNINQIKIVCFFVFLN
jgi:hypothetical protein